jgi:hypothetical protein
LIIPNLRWPDKKILQAGWTEFLKRSTKMEPDIFYVKIYT